MDALSQLGLKKVATAIFGQSEPVVFEAYSEYGQRLIQLRSKDQILAYADRQRQRPGGSVHLAVHYPEMAGRIQVMPIELDPKACNGQTHRYKAAGWGLIWVHLQLISGKGAGSFVSANSEKRALAWAPIHPELDSPSTWQWAVVTRHLRRLRRALKLAA